MKTLVILAIALACVMAAEEADRVKKEVVVGGYPYGVHGLNYARTALPYTGYTGQHYPYSYGAYPYSYGSYPYSYGSYPYSYGSYPYNYGYNHGFSSRVVY